MAWPMELLVNCTRIDSKKISAPSKGMLLLSSKVITHDFGDDCACAVPSIGQQMDGNKTMIDFNLWCWFLNEVWTMGVFQLQQEAT